MKEKEGKLEEGNKKSLIEKHGYSQMGENLSA
jgi:hypothetical protein